MRSLRLLRNVVTNYLRSGVAAALAFVLTPLMVHGLGDRDYGLWVLLFSFAGYFGIIDQGIRPSIVRYVSRARAARDDEELAHTIHGALLLYLVVGLLVFVASEVLATYVPYWLRVAPDLHAIAPMLVRIVGASIAVGLPLGVYGGVLSGLQRYDLSNALGIVVSIVRAVGFATVIACHGGLLGLAWMAFAVNTAGHLATFWTARRLVPEVPLLPRPVRRDVMLRIAGYSGTVMLGALASTLTFQTDALVITPILGPALVTPFALAAGLVDNVRSLILGATYVLAPAASELDTLGEERSLRALFLRGTRYSILLSWPVLLGLMVFDAPVLVAWVGPRYEHASLLIDLLAISTLISLPLASAASLLIGIGRHRGVVALAVAAATVNLALSIVLATHPGPMRLLFGEALSPGLVGVAMGTVVPQVLIGGILTALYACHVFKMSLLEFITRGVGRPALVCLAFLVPVLAVRALCHPAGWGPIMTTCIAAWLLFVVVAWRHGIDEHDRERWREAVPDLLRRGVLGGWS